MGIFNCLLKPVDRCLFPILAGGQRQVGWNWLTDCSQFIRIGDVKLFETSDCQRRQGASPYLEYPYFRFLEDFFEILPDILDPFPKGIHDLVDTWQKRETLAQALEIWYREHARLPEGESGNAIWRGDLGEGEETVYGDVCQALWHGVLDTAYLRYRSYLRFSRRDGTIFIDYDFRDTDESGEPCWSAGSGEFQVPVEGFLEQVSQMLNRFFSDMALQVEAAIAWTAASDGCRLAGDESVSRESLVQGLRQEHARRRDFFFASFEASKGTQPTPEGDWIRIKANVQAVLGLQ